VRRTLIAAVLALGSCTEESAPIAGDTGHYLIVPSELPGFFDCLREDRQTVVSAHRGGPARGFAENAIPTFEHTIQQGPAFLEIDIAQTRDGVMVLMHDDTVDRTTNGTGEVSSLTVEEFMELRLQDDGTTLEAHPPTLSEALAWSEDMTILELDIKRHVRFEDVIAEVRAANAMDRVVFITYSVGAAARLARLAPEAMLYVTIRSPRDLDELERRGANLSHVVAWTGDEAPDTALNRALAERGVEARFGMFDGRAPVATAETGLQSISTDDPSGVAHALDAADGVDGFGYTQCLLAR
jgi:glycerophosphoryl diester phosphodiesterase